MKISARGTKIPNVGIHEGHIETMEREDLDRRALWRLGACSPVSRLSIDDETVWIADNAYLDPDAVRAHALDLPRGAGAKGAYPGDFCFSSIETMHYCGILSRLVGKSLVPCEGYRFSPFARIREERNLAEVESTAPHWDDFCDYVGLIYLNKNPANSCSNLGTSFWRHRATGLSILPQPESPSARNLGRFSLREQADWQMIDAVEMIYNRLVVFPATLFHRIELGSTRSLEPSDRVRLTQNFYVVRSDGSTRDRPFVDP